MSYKALLWKALVGHFKVRLHPTSADEEGLADAVSLLHYKRDGTIEADDWDERWVKMRSGKFQDLKH